MPPFRCSPLSRFVAIHWYDPTSLASMSRTCRMPSGSMTYLSLDGNVFRACPRARNVQVMLGLGGELSVLHLNLTVSPSVPPSRLKPNSSGVFNSGYSKEKKTHTHTHTQEHKTLTFNWVGPLTLSYTHHPLPGKKAESVSSKVRKNNNTVSKPNKYVNQKNILHAGNDSDTLVTQ